MSLGTVLIMFIVQMAFYMIVTWYVTSIHPGPYGRAQPWYFLFKVCYIQFICFYVKYEVWEVLID